MRQLIAKFIKPSSTDGDVMTTVAGKTVWSPSAAGSTDPEVVRDTIAAALVAGANISIAVDDVGNTITISAAASGGGGGAWTLISAQKLAAPAANIDFASIPATYRDLIIEAKMRSSRASATTDNVTLRVGTGGVIDTGATSYRASVMVDTNNATAVDTNTAGTTYFKVAENACPAATADIDVWGYLRATLVDYADATYWREIEAMTSAHLLAGDMRRNHLNGHWRNKAGAIDCLRLTALNGQFIIGSSFRLYGRS